MDGAHRFPDGSPRFTEDFSSSPPYSQPPRYAAEPQTYSPQGGISPMHHSLSNKERPMSPELSSPFPESVMAEEGDKEVVFTPPPEPQPQPLPYERPTDNSNHVEERRILGMKRKWFYGLIVLLILLVIGCAVGLGVGLGTRNNSGSAPSASSGTNSSQTPSPTDAASPYAIGGAINPKYYTTKGAFNGSGIALASQSFAEDLAVADQGSLVMYFQHHSGDIRWQRLRPDGTWQGGRQSEVVASNAKNNTPLSAVAYVENSTSIWHIFYIGTDNQLKQLTNSNTSGYWDEGPLTSMNLTVLDSDQVGMQACYYGDTYGDSDYIHTENPLTGSTTNSSEKGMLMWYASDNTTFKQLGWRSDGNGWTHQQDWKNLNGHAGVGCYTWGGTSVTYVMFVDQNNTVNFYWKDTATNITATKAHPINQWTNTSISIPNVHHSTSLGYTNYIYAQMADDYMIHGYNISWAAENTSFVDKAGFTVGGKPGLPGTHLSVTALPDQSGGGVIDVFYQTTGDDVMLYTRDLKAGQWSGASMDIPDS